MLSTRYDILRTTRDIAEEYGRLKVQLWDSGIPIGENDIWIASTARANGLVVLTSDPDYDSVPDLSVAKWSGA